MVAGAMVLAAAPFHAQRSPIKADAGEAKATTLTGFDGSAGTGVEVADTQARSTRSLWLRTR